MKIFKLFFRVAAWRRVLSVPFFFCLFFSLVSFLPHLVLQLMGFTNCQFIVLLSSLMSRGIICDSLNQFYLGPVLVIVFEVSLWDFV